MHNYLQKSAKILGLGSLLTGLSLPKTSEAAEPIPSFLSSRTALNGEIGIEEQLSGQLGLGNQNKLNFLIQADTGTDSLPSQQVLGLGLNVNNVYFDAAFRNREDHVPDTFRVAARVGQDNFAGLVVSGSLSDPQILAEGGLKLTNEFRVDAAASNDGDAVARIAYDRDRSGVSLGFGIKDEISFAHLSMHDAKRWLDLSWNEESGVNARAVLGKIDKGRSVKRGSLRFPSANDISDQPSPLQPLNIGQEPRFSLATANLEYFLDAAPGSCAYEVRFQEDTRVSVKAAYRLGEAGILKQVWVAPEVGYRLSEHRFDAALEAGATLGEKHSLRIRGETVEGDEWKVAVLLEFKL